MSKIDWAYMCITLCGHESLFLIVKSLEIFEVLDQTKERP